jgi:hypothetical protein
MGKRIEALNWSKFPSCEAAEGKRWVPWDDVCRASAADERELRDEVARLRALLDKGVAVVPQGDDIARWAWVVEAALR